MRTVRQSRRLIYTLRSVFDVFSTSLLPKELEVLIPEELRELDEVVSGEKHVWCRLISVQVNLPPDQQNSKSHPDFVRKLIEDIPELSMDVGMFTCGKEEDFKVKLLTENVTLGHIFEHVDAWAMVEEVIRHFSDLSHILDYPVHCRTYEPDPNKPEDVNENFTLYNIAFFYVSKYAIPAEFFGVEERVCGYLEAKMRNMPFNIRKRMRDFREHRTELGNEGPSLKSGFLKLPRLIKGMVKTAMFIFQIN